MRGVGAFSDHVYMGGSMAATVGDDWHLGMLHIADVSAPLTSSQASRLVYSIGDCSSVATQYGYAGGLDSAPMISQMAAM